MTLDQVFALVGLIFIGAGALGTVAYRQDKALSKMAEAFTVRLEASEQRFTAAMRDIDEKRSQNVRDLYKTVEQVASSLDVKFNRSRDDQVALARDMVRRDDMKEDIGRIERSQEQTLTAINQLREQFGSVLVEMARGKPQRGKAG